MTHGKSTLADCIHNAQQYPVDGLHKVQSIRSAIGERWDGGFEHGVGMGWHGLDKIYRARAGEWTLVTGMPSSGKSNWLDCGMVQIAKEHGWKFGIFSPENQPIEHHALMLAEKVAMKPYQIGAHGRMSKDELNAALDWMDNHFHWILPTYDDNWGLDSILNLARVLVRREGINGLVIDPWNELEHARPKELSETEYISQSLTKVRRFAKTHGIHIWVVAHPTKLVKQKDGTYPPPTPYDVSGSAHWRNKADNCVTVHRDFDPDQKHLPVQIHVQKVRFRENGQIGRVDLDYYAQTATYKEHAA